MKFQVFPVEIYSKSDLNVRSRVLSGVSVFPSSCACGDMVIGTSLCSNPMIYSECANLYFS